MEFLTVSIQLRLLDAQNVPESKRDQHEVNEVTESTSRVVDATYGSF